MKNLLLTFALGAAVCTASHAATFQKVMTVLFENTGYDATLEQPFFAKLAKEGALLRNFHAEAHPSQPNYIALIAGDLMGVGTDGNVNVSGTHVGDLLEKAGKTWKVYAESYPGDCFRGARRGKYVRKHEPFISFREVQNSDEKCARIVNADELKTDLAADKLPDYSLFVPNLDNDAHDTNVGFADRWFSRTFGPVLEDPHFKDVLLVVTFDEDDYFQGNHIFTALWGQGIRPGSVSDTDYNHYSLLRMVENNFLLGNLGRNDADAEPITGIWK